MVQDFPSISFIANLLKAMMDNSSLYNGEPLANILMYLHQIENMDPNNLDVKKDDTNIN